MGGLRPVGIQGHLHGENIQSYNLFSPVMIPDSPDSPGDNPLLFSISGTGCFICPVAESEIEGECHVCHYIFTDVDAWRTPHLPQ